MQPRFAGGDFNARPVGFTSMPATQELGGYTGKSSGGPPGSVTLRRGLEKIATAANVLQELHAVGLLKMG